MPDIRVTQLPAATGLQNTDVLHGVQNADGRDKQFTLLDLQGYVNAAGVTSVYGRTGAVIAVEGDYNLNLLGDVDLSVAPTNDQVLMFDGTRWSASNIPTSPVGGMAMHYRWSTNTLSTDPGVGFVKVNAADPHLATALFINDITSLGNDLHPVYDNIEPGDVIGVWEEAASNTTLYYEVTSATDNGGWHSFGVTNIPTAAGNINNNNHVQVFVVGNPDRQLIPGGTTGQILTKTTGTNYDVQWADPAVQSVYGRTGAIVAQNGDYDLGEMGDVNLTTTPPTTGQVLRFDGTFWAPATPTSGTVTSVATGTGLTGGTITTSGTISLANTSVSAGSYTLASITVDAQGRITAASNGSAGTGTVTSVATSGALTGGPITTSGTLSVRSGTTGQTGVVQLSTSTSSTSTTLAATPSAVKTAVDNAASAQSTANSAQSTANTANSTANAALARSGGTMTGTTINTVRTITSGAWNLSQGNVWGCGSIVVPNPTSATAGTSGIIVLSGLPTGWGSNIDHVDGTWTPPSAVPAIVPFYVLDSGTILIGRATGPIF